MACGNPELQPQMMCDAVENATPDVVIVDEISNLQEVESANTVAERGVNLIATVHGQTFAYILNCKILEGEGKGITLYV